MWLGRYHPEELNSNPVAYCPPCGTRALCARGQAPRGPWKITTGHPCSAAPSRPGCAGGPAASACTNRRAEGPVQERKLHGTRHATTRLNTRLHRAPHTTPRARHTVPLKRGLLRPVWFADATHASARWMIRRLMVASRGSFCRLRSTIRSGRGFSGRTVTLPE